MQDLERIKERAHQIWQREGQPEGRHAEHWAEAEEALRREASPGNDHRQPADDRSPARGKDEQRDAPRNKTGEGGTDEIDGAEADEDTYD